MGEVGGCAERGKPKKQFFWVCQDPAQRFMELITWRKENKCIVLKVCFCWILITYITCKSCINDAIIITD